MVVKAYQSFFLSKKGALSFGIFWMKSHSTISLLLSDGDKTVSFFCMSAMTYLRAHHVYSECSHVYIYIYIDKRACICVGYCLIDFVLYQRYRMKTKRCCRETDMEIKKYAVFMYYAKVFIIRALFYHFRRDI